MTVVGRVEVEEVDFIYNGWCGSSGVLMVSAARCG